MRKILVENRNIGKGMAKPLFIENKQLSSYLEQIRKMMVQSCQDLVLAILVITSDPDRIDTNLLEYFDGFSENVQEINSKFKIRNQPETIQEAGITYSLIEKLESNLKNLSPHEVVKSKGEILPALSNLGMGYVFKELIRKFNEENNEEAGVHFSPRGVIKLMIHIVIEPMKDKFSCLHVIICIYLSRNDIFKMKFLWVKGRILLVIV